MHKPYQEPTPINGLDAAATVLLPATRPRRINVLMSPSVDASTVAAEWRQLIDADSAGVARDPEQRNMILLTLLVAFERVRKSRYRDLRDELSGIFTKTGRPMSVLGTRCELASRTAEGIFQELRRTPGSQGADLLLGAVESCLTAVLADCKQKDNPSYARRWLGIRGTTRLLLTTRQQEHSGNKLAGYLAAAADLEAAFGMGNRGSSAAAYLLDCLLHVIELDQSPAALERFERIAAALGVDERKSRTVLLLLGRFAFDRSFKAVDSIPLLNEAIEHLTASLSFPQDLASDDSFVRLIRGQALIRLSVALKRTDTGESFRVLSLGIEDLKFAVESPTAVHKQISLQPALVTRAKQFLRERRYLDARADVTYLLERSKLREEDTQSARHAEFLNLLINLREAVDLDDQFTLATTLGEVLANPLVQSQGLVAAAMAAKHLYLQRDARQDPDLLQKTVFAFEAADIGSIEDPDARRLHLGLQCRLYLLLGLAGQPDAFQFAIDASRAAIDAHYSPPDPSLLALHGEALLQFAKNNLQRGGLADASADALERAAEYFGAAAAAVSSRSVNESDGFQIEVTYSKAGESYHRLFGITGALDHARLAIHNFEQSLLRGNNAPALLGLMGDAYYRLFRLTKDPAMLDLAIAKKNAAREAGNVSRENHSLSAKLSYISWESDGDPRHLADAILHCNQAHNISPTWPWPPFQLAEIVEDLPPDVLATAVAAMGGSTGRLVDVLGQGQESLIAYGCQLVVEDEEFRKRNLGGRSPVYVLDDPHRLLSVSYVFKHTQTRDAERDRDVISRFQQFLKRKHVTGLGLPSPVAIIADAISDETVYVMRRAPGFDLGRLILRNQSHGAPAPVSEFRRALHYLAAFHAWGSEVNQEKPVRVRDFVKRQLRDLLGRSIPVSTTTLNELEAVGVLPSVLKKDAHPENWLIDERQRIWMLDFESSRTLPIVYEVAQLVDDYPLLTIDHTGWNSRLELCSFYLAAYQRLGGHEIESPAIAESFYGYCLLLRSIFGYMQSGRRLKLRLASSAQRASSARLGHHQAVLAWLTSNHPSPGVRDIASSVVKLLN